MPLRDDNAHLPGLIDHLRAERQHASLWQASSGRSFRAASTYGRSGVPSLRPQNALGSNPAVRAHLV